MKIAILVALLAAVGCGGAGDSTRVTYLEHECITKDASFPSTPECADLLPQNCFTQTEPLPASCVCLSPCG